MTPPAVNPEPRDKDGERATHMFFWLCMALVVAFFGWSYVGKLDVVSLAIGEVIPSTQVKSIQHLEGGIVREILVREGEKVKSGQALVNLEPVSSGADVEELRVRSTAIRAETARLEAEAVDAETPVFPEDLVRNQPTLVKETTDFFKTR